MHPTTYKVECIIQKRNVFSKLHNLKKTYQYLLIFQDIYSGMRDNYYRSGDGFLLVYSVDVPESTKDVEERFHGIIRARVM